MAVFATASIAIRIFKRVFWLFRMDAGLIRPHATIPWSILALFTVICMCQCHLHLLDRTHRRRYRFPAVLEVMVAFRIYLLEGRPPHATGYVILSVWSVAQFHLTRTALADFV